jgi:hypothetical protein
MKTFLAHRDAGRPWLRPMPGPFPWLLARVGGLGPNEDNPLAGTWQVAFLGETEPRAARPGNTAPASEASRPTPAAAVNKTHQRTPLSQRGAKLSTFDTLVFRSDSTLRGRHLNTQHVACRVYRTLPPIPRRQAPVRLQLDSRDQARRLLAHGPARPRGHPPSNPQWERLDAALPACRRGREPPQGALLPDRRRGGVL